MNLENEKLKRKFIRGNKKAFDTIYSSFSDAMYAICLRYSKDNDEAADILQDAFIKVYEKRKSFNPEYPLASWIKKIVVNTAIDHYNKSKKFIYVQDDNYFENQDEVIESVDYSKLQQKLSSALKNLPDGYRTIFNLYVLDNLTHQEIADYLDISINTSKSQLSRARKMLKKTLESNSILINTNTNAERA